jgi:beta-fructofuranosidase
MFELADDWVWDFWIADTGREWHLFYLHAPRSLRDPARRHAHATIGHAVSADLHAWTVLGSGLAPGPRGAFDETATWTGSVVRDGNGAWRMFYTGMRNRRGAYLQRIGVAMSEDLTHWRRHPDNPLVVPDGRWYERYGDSTWPEDAWRDPWVFRDPADDGWHMLVTARAGSGPVDDRGVIGHARSIDLDRWEVMPPLSTPGAGFGHLEVPQVAAVDGRPVLIFSCKQVELGGARATSGAAGGIWAVAADSILGPFDTSAAMLLADERLYAGRLIADRSGQHHLLAFLDRDGAGRFVGALSDPMPVAWDGSTLVVGHRRAAADPRTGAQP